MNIRQNGRRRGRPNPSGGRSSGGSGGYDNGNRIDNRARGNALQMIEKYRNMARDAQLSGDRVQTEYYLQFADHYFRVHSDFLARREEGRPQGDRGGDQRRFGGGDGGDYLGQNDDFDGGNRGGDAGDDQGRDIEDDLGGDDFARRPPPSRRQGQNGRDNGRGDARGDGREQNRESGGQRGRPQGERSRPDGDRGVERSEDRDARSQDRDARSQDRHGHSNETDVNAAVAGATRSPRRPRGLGSERPAERNASGGEERLAIDQAVLPPAIGAVGDDGAADKPKVRRTRRVAAAPAPDLVAE